MEKPVDDAIGDGPEPGERCGRSHDPRWRRLIVDGLAAAHSETPSQP